MEEDTKQKIQDLENWVAAELLKLQKQIDDIKEKLREREFFANT
jgi:hypothetical protein